jgi:hypothetical protein
MKNDENKRKGVIAILVFAILLVFIIGFVASDKLNYEGVNNNLFFDTTTKKVENKNKEKNEFPLVNSFDKGTSHFEVKRFIDGTDIKLNVKLNNVEVVKDYYLNTLENKDDYWYLTDKNVFIINGRDAEYIAIELCDSMSWELLVFNTLGELVYDSKEDTASSVTILDNENYKDGKSYYFNEENELYIMEVVKYDMENATFREKKLTFANNKVTKRFIKSYKGSTGAEG